MDNVIRLLIVVFAILAVISFKNRKQLQTIMSASPQERSTLVEQTISTSLSETNLSLGLSVFFLAVLVGLAVYRIVVA